MVGETIGRGALLLVDALAVDFVAIDVGDEGIVVGDRETEFVESGAFGEVEFTADVEGGEFITHIDDGGVIIVTVAEAGFANFPV